jgi:hypothetical protein
VPPPQLRVTHVPEEHVWFAPQVFTLQVLFVYVPDRTPLLQVRVCDEHEVPQPADEDWYAVTEAPLATVVPQGVMHEEQGCTEQEPLVYEPESVPLLHVRVCEVQPDPHATAGDA